MPHDPVGTLIDPERLHELRAAFGADTVTLDVITGERVDLRSGRVVVAADPAQIARIKECFARQDRERAGSV